MKNNTEGADKVSPNLSCFQNHEEESEKPRDAQLWLFSNQNCISFTHFGQVNALSWPLKHKNNIIGIGIIR